MAGRIEPPRWQGKPLGPPTRGAWCPDCAKPSGWQWSWACSILANGEPLGIITASTCADCGRQWSG